MVGIFIYNIGDVKTVRLLMIKMPLAQVVSQLLLSGKHDFCRLCFAQINSDAIQIQDEIFLGMQFNPATEQASKILRVVLGDKYTNDMSLFNCLCNKCIETAKMCYIFIKMCKDNSDSLTNTFDSLNDCLGHTSEDLKSFKSVFVNIDPNNFSSRQYYDNQRSVANRGTALVRFRSLVYGKYIRREKKECSVKRTRIHNYSEELSKICEVIRESNRSKFQCKVCNGVFNKSFNFKKHYYSQHSEKSFECVDCGKCYGSDALLRQHKYDSHANIVCSECGKTYKNRYSLLYHMRQHSGEQPYKCPHCDMKFQWSSRRAEHIRRYHLEPSVECDICHVKFRSLGSLYEHRKRHFNPNSRLHVMQQTPPVAEEQEVESNGFCAQ